MIRIAAHRPARLPLRLGLAALAAALAAGCGNTGGDPLQSPNGAPITSITVSAPGPDVPYGASVQLDAFATFADGYSADVTPYVAWTSDNPVVLDVAPGGVATAGYGPGSGTADIYATDPETGTAGFVTLVVP